MEYCWSLSHVMSIVLLSCDWVAEILYQLERPWWDHLWWNLKLSSLVDLLQALKSFLFYDELHWGDHQLSLSSLRYEKLEGYFQNFSSFFNKVRLAIWPVGFFQESHACSDEKKTSRTFAFFCWILWPKISLKAWIICSFFHISEFFIRKFIT